MIKKLITVAAGVGLMLATAAPAFAAVSVTNTGQNSRVYTVLNRAKTLMYTVGNTYTLNHIYNTSQITGGNSAGNNTHDGLAAAGNVTNNVTSQVEANTTNVDVDLSDNTTCNCTENVTVDWTGQNSTVNISVDDSRTFTGGIGNSGTVNNTFLTTVNSGGNSANNNTGNGTAIGGDSSVMQVITTKLNSVMLKIKM